MKLHILFGHRKEDFPGEYAPEALEVADELTMDVNPTWMAEKVDKAKKDKTFASVVVVPIDIPMNEVMARLYPKSEPIKGTVES